ncbi:DUF4062 domain-containing protein [Modestobacter sp. KNN46-3]|uniref:DUF4062 domain-containing protein n=1 Tax=Modestobacter sp. KNN46-3 TaxID=2711218 RepID=UPI0013DF93D9|nr:DUF4062 domain-containing protein [Modestobacter sp. KNN46-3]
MANLRVFISSTAFDLSVLRSSLRTFVGGLGYDPVLSDYSDVLYDPREHAHKSCLAEVRTCDMVILVIGSRFGSDLDPSVMTDSLQDLDVDRLLDGDDGARLSITQAEALTAASEGIPLFAFVDAGVYHDYAVYQRNKGQSFAKQIVYPSISQEGTAEPIFNFIDYLQGRSFNNAVIGFERIEEIVEHLRKQWAGLFQRMLAEARTRNDDTFRIDRLADQFEDLKTALLTTVGDASSRAVAKAVIRYRRLFDFLRSLPNAGRPMRGAVIAGNSPFWDLLRETAGVIGVTEEEGESRQTNMWSCRLQLEDGQELLSRFSPSMLGRLESDWQNFLALSSADREVVYDALLDTEDRIGPSLVRRAVKRSIGASTDANSAPSASTVGDQAEVANVTAPPG